MSYVLASLWRKAWQVPPGVAEELHRVLSGWRRTPAAADHLPTEVRGQGFRAWERERGRVWVEIEGVRQPALLEGRTRVQLFAHMLEAVANAETETRRLVLEIRVAPGIEFEYDDDDRGRMEFALEEMYGGQVSARLTREKS